MFRTKTTVPHLNVSFFIFERDANMHSWIVFINLSAFILGVYISSSDGAYDPALKQAAEHLSRRCEECGYYDCTCSSGGGKNYSRSKSYDYGKDDCYEYSDSSSRGKSRGGGYVKGKGSSKSKSYDYGNDDCYEYSGRSLSGGGSRGGGYESCYSGEQEYRKESGGVYCEEEYKSKGSYGGGREYKSGSCKSGYEPSSKKGGYKKKGNSCNDC